ncbi:hypothetical protein [Streptomyces regalis]|uniref:Aromatic ring-opening dioxygenase LigA n=1 Tax=Streptomyces regalis TaxID=68262 RepID=A0A0X3VFS4_9ACTN|nr:hypothetical protein [Streptomyces regalis]KUL43528.1 hypothetical protein ADL12_07740 [Streptomyces regalis]
MFLSRRSASGSPSFLRGRVALLLLVVLVAGSPWVQRPYGDFYVEKFYIEDVGNETLRTIAQAAFVPGWEYSSEAYDSVSFLVVDDVGTLLLLVGLAFFAARLLARGAGWIRCLAVGVLASEVEALLRLGMLKAFVSDVEFAPLGTLLKNLTLSALVFGLVAGVLLALLTDGLPGTRATRTVGAATASLRRRKAGGLAMTTPQVHMPVGSAPGDVTRYLCAAAYVDEGFADRVVEDVLADEASAVAPSPDVDLVAVVRHCLTAQEIRHRRDLRLTAAFAGVAVVAPLWLVFSLMFLGITGRPGSQPSLATRGHRQPDRKVLVRTGIAAGVVVLLAFYFAVILSLLPVPGFVSWLLGAYLAGIPAALTSLGAVAFAYVTVVRHELDVDRLLRTTMTRETFARQPRPTVPRRKWIADRLAAIKEARDGNATVYSGYTPFIGFAASSSKWPLTVPLLPADDPAGMRARPAEPRPFTVTELVDHVREQLQAVAAGGALDGTTTSGEETLGSLRIEDRVFASGTTIGDDDRFIRPTTLAPATRLPAEAVEQIMRRPTGTVRHYLAIHVPLWGGDVVPSVFLHFSTVGRTLHLHISNHVLGPVRADYHVVDRLRGPLTPEAKRGLLIDALLRTGRAFAGAPFRAGRHARFETRHNQRMADEIKAMEQDPVYDYGARVSIREMALSPDYHNYFQVVDAERITSLVQRHVFAAIREFLDSHGYDTTDFRAQQQTILNQGVIQQGGTSIIGNQAIGTGATATQNIPQQSGAAAMSAAGGSDK